MPTWWNGRHKRLKISGLNRPCQFESGRGYQIILPFPFKIWLQFLISQKRELFCVKTACEEVSKFGNELLQNFNDIKICSCNDTLDK
jgi:hypothetical protein